MALKRRKVNFDIQIYKATISQLSESISCTSDEKEDKSSTSSTTVPVLFDPIFASTCREVCMIQVRGYLYVDVLKIMGGKEETSTSCTTKHVKFVPKPSPVLITITLYKLDTLI
jgi:hypothetical protein